MKVFSILFFILMCGIIIYNYKSNNKTPLDMRKNQSKTSLREHSFKKALEQNIEENTSYNKKHKIETLCIQAGLKIKYGEYKLICFASAIGLPLLCLLFLNNEYLAMVSFILGFTIPSQVITFLKNRRMKVMENQIGAFLQMSTERYTITGDFAKAIKDCEEDFRGAEPFYSELKDTISELELGVPTASAIKSLGKRTGSKYINRLADYYTLAIKLGTDEARKTLLKQSFNQYDEDRKTRNSLKMAISGPANEAYIMIGFIPCTMIYNAFTNDEYISFMTQTTLGKIGVAGIFAVIIGCLWVVNTKLSAPID